MGLSGAEIAAVTVVCTVALFGLLTGMWRYCHFVAHRNNERAQAAHVETAAAGGRVPQPAAHVAVAMEGGEHGEDALATCLTLSDSEFSDWGGSMRKAPLYTPQKHTPAGPPGGGAAVAAVAYPRPAAPGAPITAESMVLLHPQCTDEVLYDYGPGLASCSQCHKRPIYNRGCRRCDKRMCPTCFAKHKVDEVSVTELAHIAVRAYGKENKTMTWAQYGRLRVHVGVDEEGGDEAAAAAAGQKDEYTRQDVVDLLLAQTELTQALVDALRRTGHLEPEALAHGGKLVLLCEEESEMHDWGPGVAHCTMCSALCLNRGCNRCRKKYCEKCFKLHIVKSKVEHLPTVTPEQAQAQAKTEAQVANASFEAVKMGAAQVPTGARQLPPDFAVECPAVCANKKRQAKVMPSEDFLEEDDALAVLRQGGALYSCSCKPGLVMTEKQLKMAQALVNLTGFKDELLDNSVPHMIVDTEENLKHIYLLNKGQYLFPTFVKPTSLTARTLSSVEFQRACQPGSGMKKTKVWTDVTEPETFRLSKPVIPLIFTVTFQMKCSVMPKDVLPSLSICCDGLTVHHAILMERTKRIKNTVDSTLKLKSMLMYHFLPKGGMVVTNMTVAVNSSVPKVAAKIVDNLASMGAGEVYETAEKTRVYFQNNPGDGAATPQAAA